MTGEIFSTGGATLYKNHSNQTPRTAISGFELVYYIVSQLVSIFFGGKIQTNIEVLVQPVIHLFHLTLKLSHYDT